MQYEWDEAKREAKRVRHGIDFASAAGFAWDTALEIRDDRYEYSEVRWIALGLISKKLHILVYTLRGIESE